VIREVVFSPLMSPSTENCELLVLDADETVISGLRFSLGGTDEGRSTVSRPPFARYCWYCSYCGNCWYCWYCELRDYCSSLRIDCGAELA
jgi:hypothetical protein